MEANSKSPQIVEALGKLAEFIDKARGVFDPIISASVGLEPADGPRKLSSGRMVPKVLTMSKPADWSRVTVGPLTGRHGNVTEIIDGVHIDYGLCKVPAEVSA